MIEIGHDGFPLSAQEPTHAANRMDVPYSTTVTERDRTGLCSRRPAASRSVRLPFLPYRAVYKTLLHCVNDFFIPVGIF
jgi:hypothetical protein